MYIRICVPYEGKVGGGYALQSIEKVGESF